MVQSGRVCKECPDHTANLSLWTFFVTEIQNALIFHSLIGKKMKGLSSYNHHLLAHNLHCGNIYKELINDQQILQTCYRHEYYVL